MKELIENFSDQIAEAIEIGESYTFKSETRTFKQVVICGLGGSGIGGNFAMDASVNEIKIPVIPIKSYNLPNFVDQDSLVIVSSYSGNTEEALSCFDEATARGAHVVVVTSNGQLKQKAEAHQLDCILIPGGHPPRACFAYSTTQLFYILAHFGLISSDFKAKWKNVQKIIKEDKAEIKQKAEQLAERIYTKIPVLYSSSHMESITIRWRQQINENGKQLCWHHVVPEMNHNELVGWRDKNEDLAVVFLRNENDHQQVSRRMDLNKEVYKKYTSEIHEIWSKGNSFIEQGIYLIHFGDWVSYFLSQLRGFDTTEVKVIDELKANLA